MPAWVRGIQVIVLPFQLHAATTLQWAPPSCVLTTLRAAWHDSLHAATLGYWLWTLLIQKKRSVYPTIRCVSSLRSTVRLSARRRQGVGVRPLTDPLHFQLLPWLLQSSFTHWEGTDKGATQGAHHWMKQARRDFLHDFSSSSISSYGLATSFMGSTNEKQAYTGLGQYSKSWKFLGSSGLTNTPSPLSYCIGHLADQRIKAENYQLDL